MNNLNYPLRASKKSHLPFFEKINDRTEIKWREKKKNIEDNLVFCIDPRKAFAVKSIPRSVFRNQSYKNKLRLFSILVKF